MNAASVRMVTRSRSRGSGSRQRAVGEEAAPLQRGEAAAGIAAKGLGREEKRGKGPARACKNAADPAAASEFPGPTCGAGFPRCALFRGVGVHRGWVPGGPTSPLWS